MEKWQKENKYARILKGFTQSQIPKWNGTKGYPLMVEGEVGVLNEDTGLYVFEERKCEYYGNRVTPAFTAEFVLHITHIFKTMDSAFSLANDDDEKKLKERFEVRLFTAKSHIDLKVAEMYYAAGQIDRLSIKESVMNLFNDNKITP